MQEIISLSTALINGTQTTAVNARDLHAFLESKQDFSNWINNRIHTYEFVEGQDYLLNKIIENPKAGGRPRIEYTLTLNMAKELGMVERTKKGRQIRNYFIECETRLRMQNEKAISRRLDQLESTQTQLLDLLGQLQTNAAPKEPYRRPERVNFRIKPETHQTLDIIWIKARSQDPKVTKLDLLDSALRMYANTMPQQTEMF